MEYRGEMRDIVIKVPDILETSVDLLSEVVHKSFLLDEIASITSWAGT